jgi:mannonate dehydratase
MNLRQFISISGVAAAAVTGGALAPSSTSAAPTKRALMTLGYRAECNDAGLKAALCWGIKNVYARPPIADPGRLYAALDELKQMRDAADRNGVRIEILRPTSNLAMTHIDIEKHPATMLGDSPRRDRDIEAMQTQIKNCAAVRDTRHEIHLEHRWQFARGT